MRRCVEICFRRRGRNFLLLALYACVAAVWTWRLQSDPLPPEDPLRGERLERVARYLSKAPSEVRQSLGLSLAMVSDERLATLDDWTQLPPMQQLRQLTVQESPLDGGGDCRDALLLAWLGQTMDIPAIEAHVMIAAAGERIDDSVKMHAMQTLSLHAMADADPQAAATILERSCDLPGATWETVRRFVDVCRVAHRPDSATRAITAWIINQAGATDTVPIEEARDLEASLMVQSGRAEEALTRQLELIESAPAGAISEILLDRACVCAQAASQPGRVLPWVEQHLTTFPEHRLDPKELMQRQEIDPNYRRWMHRLAALADGELPLPHAFEACLRLSACGDAIALDRLCALAGPAGREPDAEQHLNIWLHDAGRRALAVALAAKHDLARRIVANWLRQFPRDRDLHFVAAEADAASKPAAAAAVIWQTFLHDFPGDAAAQRRLVEVHLRAQQPTMALRVLNTMSADSLTDEDQRQRALLRQL